MFAVHAQDFSLFQQCLSEALVGLDSGGDGVREFPRTFHFQLGHLILCG